ncbi:MAG: hypothetical protein AB7O62_15745 [Pirellulales bacterium]
MSAKAEPTITVEQAARLIYRTNQPTSLQVGEVASLLKAGVLRQSERQNFTTTRTAVAEYLAAQELRRQEARRSVPSNGQASRRKAREGQPEAALHRVTMRELGDRKLRRVYRELLSDHFLSIIVGGRARSYSAEFQSAVFALRCILLAMLLGVGVWLVGHVRFTTQEDVVRDWLRDNATSAEVLECLPAHFRPGGKAIRVRYRHVTKDQQTQDADRVFLTADGEVLRVVLPDEEDDELLEP